jgi:ribokinase
MVVWVSGSLNQDVVLRVQDLPRAGETVAASSLTLVPGGKGANQATAAARYGARTLMIGAVGGDEAGAWLREHLRAAGVDVSHVAILAGEVSGQAHICVSDAGENSIVITAGANARLAPEHAPRGAPTTLLAQLETPIETTRRLFSGVARALRILNAAPAIPAARELFSLADILIVNETELARYAGDDASTPEAARRLISRPEQSVIVTLGAAGALAIGARSELSVAGRAARVVDTTGAGDCFCGVLAAALDARESLGDAMAMANAAAALSTQRHGAGPSMPTRAEIEAALA